MPSSSIFHITDLERMVNALPAEDHRRFRRLYHLSTSKGAAYLPQNMHPWVVESFGSLEAVQTQTIVKITNLITLDGTTFNSLRSRRPIQSLEDSNLQTIIDASTGDAFCNPLTETPEDTFGRIRGKHCVSASNVAKSDGLHGLVIFNEHNPLYFTQEMVADYFTVALKWAKEAHNVDREARYFFFVWNCLWKAGASIIHGHAQTTLSRGIHYPKIEHWRRSALLYHLGHGSNYFDDLIAVHRALGLSTELDGVHILAHLTPTKEKEILIIGERPQDSLYQATYLALETLTKQLGTHSFSLALYWRPIDGVEEDWSGFPTIVRIVDRGDPENRTTDIGSMELYGISVVSSDPFHVARALQARVDSP